MVGQEISSLLQGPESKSSLTCSQEPATLPLLFCQMNPVHVVMPNFFTINFNIILP
jgi:hypothetical protein